MFGNPGDDNRCKALKFYASVRLDIPPHRAREGEGRGHRVARARQVVKTRSRRRSSNRVDIMYAGGYQPRLGSCSTSRPVGNHRQVRCVVQLRRAAIGQGRENAKMYLKDNPSLLAEVEER